MVEPLDTVPFNAFQKELWLGCQTSLTDYSETSTRGIFRIAKNISPIILREAVRVVLRHMPLLGATLRQNGAEPCLDFGAAHDIDLRTLDLRDDPAREETVQSFTESFLDESVEEQFVRYAVIRMAESECVFLFKCSHLVLDGLGYFFHVSFLAEVYSALLHAEPLDLGEPCSLREQYEADEAYRASERAKKDVAFWEKQLERLPERRIFRALPGRPDKLGNSRHKKFVLSEDTSRQIADLLARRGIGPAAYFTALHALVVAYMCDEKNLVIQTPIAFGERKSIRKRQGVRMATPSLFLEMGQFDTLAQLLEAIGKQSADFFRHVRTPFQLSMRQLPHKNLAHIADTFINYLPGRPLGTPDFPIVWIDQNHSEKEPVLLGALVMEECLTRQYALLVRNSRNHLSDRDVDRYVRRLEHLTRQLASGVELPQLDYLLDEEKRELASWETGEVRPYPVASMPALFDEAAESFAERVAVRDESGAALSYAELRNNSLRCASWLAAQGVGKGDVVAVLARRTLFLPEIVLGIQRLGAVYLPVDPKAPAERIAFILADSGAALTVDSAAPAHTGAPLAQLPQGPKPGDGAYLIYTSGSTGKPKGVLAPHCGFANMIQGQIEIFGVGPEDRVLQFAPPIFDASLSEMFMALFAGACLYPVSDESRNAPWSLRQYMTDNGVSIVTFPPSYLRLFERESFPSLRVLITAGEPPVAADALHYAGALRYFNAYGPTETCVCASMKRVAPQEALPISSGRPIPNAVARIVDSQGRSRPAGMVGELWVGGASVALGYHRNPELTERRFRALPGQDGCAAYATGDLALWTDSGELLLVGRADDQVKIRGNRVELGEVTFLLESCPGVRQAAVLVVKDGSDQTSLAAFLLLRPEATLEAVVGWSRENLPAYMIPSSWHVLDSMPVTRTGKVDRQALLNISRSPALPKEQGRAVEQRLLDIFERVLGQPYNPVVNFFDQGGNSLLAMSLLHQFRKLYAVDVAFRDFVTCETLFDVEAMLRGRAEQVVPEQCSTAPLSRGQYRIWAYQQANAGAIDYNMPLLLEAEGDGADRFVAALREAVEEQELLTCAVVGDIDAPHFAKWPGARIPLSAADFSDAASAMAHFDALIHMPFDLRGEAPARIAVARVGGRVQALLLVHHLVADGETLDVVVRNALDRLSGGHPPKGTLAVQAAFCRREEEYLRSEAARTDADYWRKTFTPPLAPLNTTPSPERRGAMAFLPLPQEVEAGLERQAKASGVTVLSCFVALLARFLCRSYGREEMLLGLPVGLRETAEESRTAGFFVSTVVLRLHAEADARFASRQLREALPHSRSVSTEATPDFLATHAHAEPLAAPDFALRRLAPRLRASKFTGSFLLQTGEAPCLVLEHDATFIPDGEAFLGKLLREMVDSFGGAGEVGDIAPRDPRQLLADAWAEILRVEAGEQGDFFRAGGDSIKAIQITGLLHRNGVTALSAPDFLRTPAFLDLCALLEHCAEPAAAIAAAPLPPGTQVCLLPIQKIFLQDHPDHWKIFHMLLPLKIGPGISTEAAEAWLKALPQRFQALGLAFSPAGAVVLEQPQEPSLLRQDFPADMPHPAVLRAMARSLVPKVDPEAGRTLAAGLATVGAERILAIVGHHLTLDVLSLDILQGDLERFLRGEPSGESCGMATRAVEAQRLVDAGAFPTAEQRAFWESVLRTPVGSLSALGAQGAAHGLTTSRVRLAGFRAELSASVFVDLLSALAVALNRAGQREGLLVTLKSHGRDELLPGQDLSRSLGWFTALCPMPLIPAGTCAEAAEAVRPFVQNAFTPLSCNAFGYLRLREPDRFAVKPQVGFNYLGARAGEETTGQVVPLLSLAAPGDISELLHPDFEPDCPLDLTAWFDATGELHLLAYYPPLALPEAWVVGLLEAWADAARTLPAYRPPLPEETQAALLSACSCQPEDIEHIGLPWPSHESMLYQHLAADNGVYTQQIEFHFGGRIDEFLLMRAWAAVVDRHESLRTLFPMPHHGEFCRVVLRCARTSTEYHDLAHLTPDAARFEAEALLRAHRNKGFDLGRGPLLRALFLRLDQDTLALCWCFHHLLMDGWCIGILQEELFTTYARLAGRASRPLPAPFPLSEYERWRTGFDKTAAKAYWEALLEGFIPLTGVTGPASTASSSGDPQTRTLTLDAALSQKLMAVAVSQAVTLPALIQALWALVLSAENGGCRDVVFGLVTSGRPGELNGVGRAVGLFIETLPVRARWTADSSLGELLNELKEQGLQQMRHGYLPMAELGGKLLDHLLVFENYPFESPFGEDGPRLLDVRGYEKIPYPLGISVIPGEELMLRFLYDPALLPQARVAVFMNRLHAALCAAAAKGDISCRGLEAAVAAVPHAEVIHQHCVPQVASTPAKPSAAVPPPSAETAVAVVDVVREIYAAVLGHADPSPDADFHLLGGHSLSLMSVMAQVAKRLNVKLSIDDILANPTPRKLAARIRSAAVGSVSIPRVPPEGSHPLSASQERIWFLQRLQQDSRVYQIPFAARLRAPVDKSALQAALLLLETRHEALRLRISADAPEQRLLPPGGLQLEYHEGLCPELTHGPSPMPLGLDQSLVRVALYRQAEGDFILYFSVHHIVFDGWSAAIVMREFNQAYAAALHGATPAWAPLELDYLSYAVWERKQEPEGLDALRDALLPLPELLRLPLDYPRPAMRSNAGAVQTFRLGNSQGRQLKALANAAGVTLFPVLVAVVNAFLHRHTGQSDMIVGCPAASRVLPQTQNMVGLLVNTLAIRTVFDPEAGFGDLVRAADAALKRALGAQTCPFEKLVEALGVERDLSRNPLFDVFVALEGAEWTSSDQPPLHMAPLYLPHDRSKFDLSFYFREVEPDTYEVHLEYSAELFAEATAQAMCQRLSTLIDAVLKPGALPVCALDMLPECEQARLRGFNDTHEALDIERHVDSWFVEQARKTPGNVAILDSLGQSCTYAEFDALVSALARHLAGQGLARGDHAAVCFERTQDMMACVFAVMRLGAVYVPISLNLPEARLRSAFEDLGQCAVICAPERAGLFAACGQRVLAPDLRLLPYGDAEAHAGDRSSIAPGDVAYVIFTSGSTGRPKGVQIEHRSVCNRLLWMQARFPLGPGDVVLQKTTATFDVSVWELFWWSWSGAALALLEPGAEGDPARIVEAVHTRGVTVLHFVPSMLRVFLDYLEARQEETARLSSLRYVFTSGEALPRELVARFNAVLGAELHNLYGPTEATVDVSWQPCLETPPHTVSIGRPVSNTGLHVLDARLRPVPIGVAGELWISGVQVARGYVNRPELTAKSFLSDPATPGGRMYRTGDLGRWLPDGSIEYLGRNDDQVKVRGHRIELGEVEAALGRCADVAQAAVRVCRVGGHDALEAFLLPRGNAALTLRGIRDELAGILPDYMIPALFHAVDEIPLSPSGKADRKRLKGTQLVHGNGCATGAAAGAAEERDLHAAVRELWQRVMPEVDVRDADLGFFEAGGNSLLLVQLQALFEERWPGVFTLASLFSESSIRAQARFIEQAEQTGQAEQAGRTHGAVPPRIVAAATGPVAIIGMAVRIGDYEDTERFWQDLAAGADKNVPLPEKRKHEVRQIFEAVGYPFDASKLREAAYLSDISSFDCKRFGMSPGDAGLLDPKQRVFLETALRALDDAGYGGAALEGASVGVFVGASPYRLFQDAVTRSFPDQSEQIYLLNVPSNMMARLSYLKNWSGPAAMVDTACSSVLKAAHDACTSLRQGECSVALVGGAHTIDLPIKADKAFTIEATSGLTRTFDAEADGVGAGEGAAVFVLKRLDDALRDHDPIHALILGSAVNQDGRASSMAAPNPDAQAAVIVQAAANAQVSLADVSFFEAHGTATILGDPVEIEGLSRAFAKQGAPLSRKAPIGSVKGNLGHLDAAAGAVGLAKAVLCLEKGLIPPQPHFTRPNPHIDFDAAPVRVAQGLAPLPQTDRPWRCGVSAFGLSGVNTHVVMAEHAPATLPEDDGAWFCVPLSAQDEHGLQAYRRSLREALVRDEALPLHAIAATLALGREHLETRAAIVAQSRQELLNALTDDVPFACAERQGRTAVEALAVYAVCPTREQAEAAAQAFLRGGRLLWPAERPLHRAHLPATPFARSPLWPRFVERFLFGPTRTPAGDAYEIGLDRPEFWPVAQHRLNGVPTLVGMALPDLIGNVAGPLPLCLADVRWRRPVTLLPGSRATLLVAEGEGARTIELHHFHDAAWNVAASATLRSAAPPPPAALDLALLRQGLLPLVEQGEPGLVSVSERWSCREELLVSEDGDRLLARIVLQEPFRHDLHSFRWHPAMMDVAASLALHGLSGYVPARCAEMRLYRALPASVHAHVVITERQQGMISARCAIADSNGNVLAELTDMLFLSLAQSHPDMSEGRTAAGSQPLLYTEEWVAASPPPAASSADDAILLLGSGLGALGEALAGRARLRRELPAAEAERKILAEEILSGEIRNVVYLPAPGDAPWAFPGLLQELCRMRPRSPVHITAVADGGLLNIGAASEQALVLGPLLCLPQEEPLVLGTYVELASQTPAALRTFLAGLGRLDGPCVIDAEGAVRVRRFAALDAAQASLPALSPEACVVISGGLGGMGLTLARQIAAATGARVALLYRSGQTPPDLPFAAYRCDVTDAAQVAETLADIRREVGPIQGVIHAAGVAGGGYLLSKTQAAYEAVLAPKVAGTWNLHRATLDDGLRFFVLASSRTALTGAPGQCDYTAANAFLNAFARYRRGLGLPALSLCWNTWSGVGMAARLGADQGGPALDPERALGVLAAALGRGTELAVVAMPGEEEAWRGRAALSVPATPASGAPSPSFEAELLEIFRDCLGYDTELTRDDDFFELGGDSIAATRVVSRIDKALGLKASVMDLLEADTLGGFIDRVLADCAKAAPARQGLEPAPERDKYPLGREQLSILYAYLLGEANLGYNLPAFLKLPGGLDKVRLEQAVAELIQRHEVLRTTLCDFEAEHPNMIIHPFAGFTLEEVRLPDLSHKDALITPFDMRREAGFRVKLLVTDAGENVLFYDIHHALADGRTISLLNTELYRLYHGLPLEPVGAQQKDFAWRQFTRSDAEDREYWLPLFQGELPQLNLPADYERPAVFTAKGGMYEFELSERLVAGVKSLARREGATNYHVVLAAWALLAHAYTGTEDLVLSITVDSRGEHLNTAGMLASLLPLRLAVDGAKPLAALLKEVQRTSNEALRHSGYILNNLLTDLRYPACLDRSPLCEVILSYMNFEFASDVTQPPQLFEALRFGKSASKTDLSIFASDTGSSISFALEYYADLFRHESIVHMAEDLTRILEAMVEGNPDEPVPFTFAPPVRRGLATATRELGCELSHSVKRLAELKGVSAVSVLLATFAILLSRVAVRRVFEVDVAGCGPVRFHIDDETEFDELLRRTDASLAEGFRTGAGQTSAQGDAGLRLAFAWSAEGATPGLDPGHDLACSVQQHAGDFSVHFEHDTKALTAEAATAWLGHYVQFLAAAAKGSE